MKHAIRVELGQRGHNVPVEHYKEAVVCVPPNVGNVRETVVNLPILQDVSTCIYAVETVCVGSRTNREHHMKGQDSHEEKQKTEKMHWVVLPHRSNKVGTLSKPNVSCDEGYCDKGAKRKKRPVQIGVCSVVNEEMRRPSRDKQKTASQYEGGHLC